MGNSMIVAMVISITMFVGVMTATIMYITKAYSRKWDE